MKKRGALRRAATIGLSGDRRPRHEVSNLSVARARSCFVNLGSAGISSDIRRQSNHLRIHGSLFRERIDVAHFY